MNEGRREIIQIAFIAVAIIFLVKLFIIQVVDRRYKDLADSNAIHKIVDYPDRGLIKDRNGKVLVYNTPEFDIQIISKEVKNLDSARFCQVLPGLFNDDGAAAPGLQGSQGKA
jgi:penicillin-binding protein 2